MQKTPLHHHHIDMGAKMGAFAGYDMPLFYKLGVKSEHLWTRSSAGIFDVSHMGQAILSGSGAAELCEHLTPSSFAAAPIGMARYTVLMGPQGGIIDDLIITKLSDDRFFFVYNAGCKDKDESWIIAQLPDEGVDFTILQDRALIALQGPKAEEALQIVLGVDLTDLAYMRILEHNDLYISRLGYTGEDGFEISVKASGASDLWENLCALDIVEPIGLAARDSLRLEMGYPLYGHDIDETTSPIEAGIGWIVHKKNPGEFLGAQRVLKEKDGRYKLQRRRVGVKITGKGIAREGAEIFADNEADEPIGTLTSGGFSPSLEMAIGQAYVRAGYDEIGTKINVRVRGRDIEAEVASMPFMPPKTKTMKK